MKPIQLALGLSLLVAASGAAQSRGLREVRSWGFGGGGVMVGIPVGELSPIEKIGHLRAPVLVIGGAEDHRTTPEETRALFAAAPCSKELWLVPGAAHVDLCRYAGADYRRRVLEFFNKHLAADA